MCGSAVRACFAQGEEGRWRVPHSELGHVYGSASQSRKRTHRHLGPPPPPRPVASAVAIAVAVAALVLPPPPPRSGVAGGVGGEGGLGGYPLRLQVLRAGFSAGRLQCGPASVRAGEVPSAGGEGSKETRPRGTLGKGDSWGRLGWEESRDRHFQ